jgi:hypothetical protein
MLEDKKLYVNHQLNFLINSYGEYESIYGKGVKRC